MASLAEPIILRRASIYQNPGNPADILNLGYGDMTIGELGTVPAIEIQKWDGATQVFQIFDHPISTVPPVVYTDDVLVDPVAYVFNPDIDFENQGRVATLTFFVDQTGKNVSLTCAGKLNLLLAPEVMTNPIDILYDLIVAEHGAGDQWDDATAQAVRQKCAENFYTVGGVISADSDPVTVANEMLKPLGGAGISGGKLRFYFETLPPAVNPDEWFEAYEIEDMTLTKEVGRVTNAYRLLYRYNARKAKFLSSDSAYDQVFEAQDDQSVREFDLHMGQDITSPWVRDARPAEFIVLTQLGIWGRPTWRARITTKAFKGITLKQGDAIAVSHKKHFGGNARGAGGDRRVFRVLERSISKDGVTLQALDLKHNAWYDAVLANGTWLADGSFRAGGNP